MYSGLAPVDPDCPHKDNYHVYTEVDFSKNKIKLFYSENYIFLNQFTYSTIMEFKTTVFLGYRFSC